MLGPATRLSLRPKLFSISRGFLRRRKKSTLSAANIETLSSGSGVEIEWNNGKTSRFHSSWLRFCCQCEKCKQAHSGQRTFDIMSLPDPLKVMNASVTTDQKNLVLSWENEVNHEGRIGLQWLKEHSYSDSDLRRQSQLRTTEPYLGDSDCLPVVKYEDIMESKEGLWKMVSQLSDHGISLVKNVPLDKTSVIKVGQRLGPIQTTIYGETFEVVSTPNPINIAFSNAPLRYHMDLMYYESPPGLQLLHCLKFDPEVEGGESMFLDVFNVVEELRRQHPEDFDNLVRIPATFQKIHFERDYAVKLVYKRPHIVVNPDKQVIAVNWSPSFEGPLSVPEEDVEPYFAAYRKLAKLIDESPIQKFIKLQSGDLVCFNNRRILHGRKAFVLNGAMRQLMGAYVNIDEFRNTFQVLSEKVGIGKPCKRIGNQCSL